MSAGGDRLLVGLYRERAARLATAAAALAALHRPIGRGRRRRRCAECRLPWPCTTAAILEDVLRDA
jgi:hypothetical protein